MHNEQLKGHLMALACTVFWGTAYIGSKNLLAVGLAPPQIILCRQGVAFLIMCLLTRNYLPIGGLSGLKRDRFLIAAGIMGAAMYYLLESTALQYTYATNVSLMVATSPLFATLFNRFLPGPDRTPLCKTFFYGLALCLIGVALVILNGTRLQLNPLGDCIGLLASASWAGYSFFLKRAQRVNDEQDRPLNDMELTRRSLFYGIMLVLVVFLLGGGHFRTAIFQTKPLLTLFYLGALPSACAFLLWGRSIQRIGMLNASLYVNLSPLVASSSAALLLGEQLTLMSGLGMAAIVLGLAFTQNLPSLLASRLTQSIGSRCAVPALGGKSRI